VRWWVPSAVKAIELNILRPVRDLRVIVKCGGNITRWSVTIGVSAHAISNMTHRGLCTRCGEVCSGSGGAGISL
jgi:hypothetical protein